MNTFRLVAMSKSIKLFVILFSLLISNGLKAQSLRLKLMPLSVAYYGENAIHPGLKLGTYFTVWSKEKSKIYRNENKAWKFGTKSKLNELNVDFNFGGYSHPNNHSGYFTNLGMTFLHKNQRTDRLFGVSFEAGYLRRDYKFKTYELDENGNIREVKAAGNNALSFGLAPQFGQEVTVSDHTVRFYVKPILQLVQYGHSWQPNAAIELGTVINIHRIYSI